MLLSVEEENRKDFALCRECKRSWNKVPGAPPLCPPPRPLLPSLASLSDGYLLHVSHQAAESLLVCLFVCLCVWLSV